MIVRDRPNAFQLLFILRGSVVPRILPQLLVITLLAAGVQWLHAGTGPWLEGSVATPFAIVGLALSLFLGLRANNSYDRWWEARREWGRLIFESRSLVRALAAFLQPAGPEAAALAERLGRLEIAFAHALCEQLRGREPGIDWRPHLPAETVPRVAASANAADAILRQLSAGLGEAGRRGWIGEITQQALEARVQALSGVQAACERIRGTPLPFAYTLLLHRTAYVFCLLLPFALVDGLDWATPLAVALVAYTFFGLDALSDELEEPFGREPNDLPLAAMVRTVEIGVLEGLGLPAPEPLRPKRYLLT